MTRRRQGGAGGSPRPLEAGDRVARFGRIVAEGLEARVLLSVATSSLAAKVGTDLAALYSSYSKSAAGGGLTASSRTMFSVPASQPDRGLMDVAQNRVLIDAIATGSGGARLRQELSALGAQITGRYGRMVSAMVPLSAIPKLATQKDLNFARPSYRPQINAGLVDDQAVQALQSNVGSAHYGVDGSGVTVGILSDSFDTSTSTSDHYAQDVASGDLPAGVNILADSAGHTDEGRAMAQLVHDVAPGSPLAFHTAYNGEADFAQGIINLAKPTASGGAGAKVITDDVIYLDEPMFQDGVVAQAANTAVTTYGASYFSSAGNEGHSAYQSTFHLTTLATRPPQLDPTASLRFHDFAGNPAAPDIYQPISLSPGSQFLISFQWDQPYASAGGATCQSDVDIYLYDSTKQTIVAGATSNNLGKDPTEILNYTNPSTATSSQFYLVVNVYAGPTPGFIKYVSFSGGTIGAYQTNTGAQFGHSMAANAAGVAAAYYGYTPAYGVSPPIQEGFSSAGGTPFLFSTAGARLSSPDLRQQPRFTAVDGTDTNFFYQQDFSNGLYQFFGTSAAAPHAAAVAALLKQAVPSLTAAQIYSAMQSTAIDMGAAGYDFDTGYGLIQADRALAAVAGSTISGQTFRDYNNNGVRDSGEPAVAGVTVFLDSNGNGIPDSGASGPIASSDVPKPIPDESPNPPGQGNPSRVTSALTVSGLTGRVTDVNVTLSITHPSDYDLGATLISPSGIRVPLFTNVPSFGQNFTGTTFDDSASLPIQSVDGAPYSGTYRPQVPLADLNGEDPNGTWQLEVRDYYADNSGTLNSWSLNLSYADPTTTSSAAGQYSFTGLSPSSYYGPYKVRQVVPAGFTQSAPASPYNLTLAAATTATGKDFGEFAPLSTVASIVLDDGTVQRSMIRKIVVTFNGAVAAADIAAGAFTVVQTSGPASTFTTGVASVTALSGNQTAVTLTFGGAGIVGGSLADGHYTLTIDGSKIVDSTGAPVDAAGNGTPGSSRSLSFFRFFGDSDGNGFVNNTDYANFKDTYAKGTGDPGYSSVFDYDGNGFVNNSDYSQFKDRYATAAP